MLDNPTTEKVLDQFSICFSMLKCSGVSKEDKEISPCSAGSSRSDQLSATWGSVSAFYETCTTLESESSWSISSAFGISADFAPKLRAIKSGVIATRRSRGLLQGL
eukprot:IDg23593t1